MRVATIVCPVAFDVPVSVRKRIKPPIPKITNAIDGAAAESSDQLERLFRTAAADTAWLLTVQRGGDRQTLALEKR